LYSINIFINLSHLLLSIYLSLSNTTSPLFCFLITTHSAQSYSPFLQYIVLASKGIDASLVDAKVERKASIPRLTAEQDRRIEALRKELTAVEERLREANEMELPEEDLRIESESKREELNVLIAAFHEANFLEKNSATGSSNDGKLLVSTNKPTSREHQEGSWMSVSKDGSGLQRAPLEYTGTTSTSSSSKDGDGAAGPKKFERPSERRRRLEQEKGGGGYDDRGGYGGGGGGGNDDAFSNFGNNRGGGGRGDGRGGGGGYNNRNNDEGYNNGGRGHQSNNSNNSGYNEKYASDRYNY